MAAIHGNKSQSARQAALGGFAGGRVRVLVATDIAARGIDVPGVSHVINFEMPKDAESYVHRIGRTARAEAEGCAISLCAPDERGELRDIERLLRRSLPVFDGNHLAGNEPVAPRHHSRPSDQRVSHIQPDAPQRDRHPRQHRRRAA